MILFMDLDGTLGNSDAEIARTLTTLKPVFSKCLVCIVTGRSLRGLARLTAHLPSGIYVSPWGGGNVMWHEGGKYSTTQPLDHICAIDAEHQPTYVCLSAERAVDAGMEHHCSCTQLTSRSRIVGAYWSFDKGDRAVAFGVAQAYGGHMADGRDKWWVTLTPHVSPRMVAVERTAALHPGESTIYVGDSCADAECIDSVGLFLAPAASELGEYKRTTAYSSYDDLATTLTDIITPGAGSDLGLSGDTR